MSNYNQISHMLMATRSWPSLIMPMSQMGTVYTRVVSPYLVIKKKYGSNCYISSLWYICCLFEQVLMGEIISIFHGCMVWIEKYVTRVTDRHH